MYLLLVSQYHLQMRPNEFSLPFVLRGNYYLQLCLLPCHVFKTTSNELYSSAFKPCISSYFTLARGKNVTWVQEFQTRLGSAARTLLKQANKWKKETSITERLTTVFIMQYLSQMCQEPGQYLLMESYILRFQSTWLPTSRQQKILIDMYTTGLCISARTWNPNQHQWVTEIGFNIYLKM